MLRLILIPVALVLLTGCQQPKPQSKQAASKSAPKVVVAPPAATTTPTNPPTAVLTATPPPALATPPAVIPTATPPIEPTTEPKIEFDPTYDSEIKEVFRLANKNQWEDARAKSAGLLQFDPKNTMLQRLNTWVVQQGQRQRDKALEDAIRNIDSKNSTYNPTALDLITEKKDHGIPARKNVRDAVDLIENTPWIPKNFGKTISEQGPLFDFDAAKGPTGKVLEKEVTIHADNIPFETVIFDLSQSSGVNIIADKSIPALTNRLMLNFDKIKLGQFFKYAARNYEVQFQVGQDLVWMTDSKSTNRLMEEVRFYKLRKGFVLPAQLGAEDITRTSVTVPAGTTVTETQKFKKFVNDDAPIMPAIERAITNLFKGSTWMIDFERNLIMARGSIEQLDVMEKIIKEFDQPIQQVLIEARFVTLSKGAFMQLGLLWETGRQAADAVGVPRTPQDFTGLAGNQVAQSLGLGVNYTFTNILNQSTLTATISALEQSGESHTLSAPRLLVINNRPASINDGKVQYYYEQYQVQTTLGQYVTASSWVPQGTPTKITSGASLNVMASIAGDGRHILLALNPSVKTDVVVQDYSTLNTYDSSGKVISSFAIKLPVYRTQELATRAVVKSGETVAMGGVLERQTTELVESVPVLGSLPFIGALFRRRTAMDTPRYLLVFVTATIMNDSGDGVIFDEATGSNKSK